MTGNIEDPTVMVSDTIVVPGPTPQERLAKLKKTADDLGLPYSSRIGSTALSKKINDYLDGEQDEETIQEAQRQQSKTTTVVPAKTDPRILQMRKAQKLLLVKVVCMNPAKKEWGGEIITVGNSVIGTYRKYVKFNADRGWYIPQIMYNVMKSRKCQLFKTVKVNGRKIRQGYLVDEFAMTILPNQTKEELAKEAARQAAANALLD